MYEDAAAYGAGGVALKLKGTLNDFQSERRGAMVDWRRRLRESSVCGRSFSHKDFGKEGGMPARMLRK